MLGHFLNLHISRKTLKELPIQIHKNTPQKARNYILLKESHISEHLISIPIFVIVNAHILKLKSNSDDTSSLTFPNGKGQVIKQLYKQTDVTLEEKKGC